MITLAEIKVKVKCPERDGYFLRWYFNGWHSFFFVAGGESYETKGEWWNTQSKSKVKFGTAFLTQNEIKSIRTMLFAKRVEVLLKDGWKAIIVDSTSLKIEDTRTRGYKCEFTAAIYAKVADYTPVKEIPIVEMDNVRITPENDIRVTPEGDVRVVTSTEYDPIVSYVAFPTITRFVGEDIPLPNTATVTYKSGRVETLVVKWENVKNNIAGTFKVYGDVGSGGYAVVQEVILIEQDDLYWLRKIRDANPSSQLPLLWLDSEDPYTQWKGLTWSGKKLEIIDFTFASFYNATSGIVDFSGMRKLKNLTALRAFSAINTPNVFVYIDVSWLYKLTTIEWTGSCLKELKLKDCTSLTQLKVMYSLITNMNTLESRGLITSASFDGNYITQAEVDRLLSIGFTASEIGTQNP